MRLLKILISLSFFMAVLSISTLGEVYEGKPCNSNYDCHFYDCSGYYCVFETKTCTSEGMKDDGTDCRFNAECKSCYCSCEGCSYDCGSGIAECKQGGHYCMSKSAPSQPPAETEETVPEETAPEETVPAESTPTEQKELCMPCSTNADCKSGNCAWFDGGKYKCSVEGGGMSCCPDGHPFIGGRTQNDCCIDSDCKQDQECEQYKCVSIYQNAQSVKKFKGDSCTLNAECQTGWCNNAICCDYGISCCRQDYDCEENEFCLNRPDIACDETGCSGAQYYCAMKRENPGETCSNDKECVSNDCVNGKCGATNLMSLVFLVEPNDTEAKNTKRLVEDIYQSVIKIFDKGSKKVSTGKRILNIKLVMTDKDSVAMWDEATRTITVPYASKYAAMGNFDGATMQRNAIAHELSHYHLNGIAEKAGGNYKDIPLWFKEGIAEYVAHAYFKMLNPDKQSPSEARREVLVNYLSNPDMNYLETVEDNAASLVSWKKESDMDTSLPDYDHLHYGAAFSFVNYFLSKSNPAADESMMDLAKYMFAQGSKGKFKFYAAVDSDKEAIKEKNIKKDWFNGLNAQRNINASLGNRPGLFKRIGNFFGWLFS